VASIVYAMCGEGRGHATRARTVVESLRARHEVTLFASGCAHEMLAPLYRGTEVLVHRIPGLHFAYTRSGRVALLRTVADGLRFRMSLARHVSAVMPALQRARPDLVIADFEPILPRAARACGVPFVSFDHQHYLVVSDLRALPWGLRQRAAICAPCVRALYDWQKTTIVSSFYKPPLKPAYRGAVQVGPLIRPEVRRARPVRSSHLVAYIRRQAPPGLLPALAASGREVRLYGLGEREPHGQLRFLPIDQRRFVDDLASCAAVISTAGNQLVGEALHLGKPLLVLPEPRNFEQAVNGHFLEQSGAGWCETGRLTPARLGTFLERLDELRARIQPVSGNQAALDALERQLDSRIPERDTAPVPREQRA
jgi:uncharacterized protein (TIGR00661 family)